MLALKSLLRTGANYSQPMKRCASGCVRWAGAGCRQISITLNPEPTRLKYFPPATGSIAARGISCTARASHGDHEAGFENAPSVELVWETADGETKRTAAKCGMNLMRVAHAHGIELEGACEGVCACSTCHVILPEEVFASLPEASEEEEDMLDMAFGLTETSRLGCQVIVTEDMEGVVVKLPPATRNFYVDGHIPQPH